MLELGRFKYVIPTAVVGSDQKYDFRHKVCDGVEQDASCSNIVVVRLKISRTYDDIVN